MTKKPELTDEELKIIKRQLRGTAPIDKKYKHHYGGKKVRIGVISDTHIGSKSFKPELMDKARQYMLYNSCEAVYHAGDIIEGMSGRDGHIYELTHLGVSAQLQYAADLINQWEIPFYAILGNHDEWASNKMNMGVNVGSELESKCKGFKCLGGMEADVELKKGVVMKLFHPNGGSAYAPGYKLMKLAESFSGGEKPNMVFQGHYHKSLYMFSRNIHLFEAGTLQGQSLFMRGKSLASHLGFWVVDVYFGPHGVERITNEFHPKYD
jgi:predicted phosphodiesterase